MIKEFLVFTLRSQVLRCHDGRTTSGHDTRDGSTTGPETRRRSGERRGPDSVVDGDEEVPKEQKPRERKRGYA